MGGSKGKDGKGKLPVKVHKLKSKTAQMTEIERAKRSKLDLRRRITANMCRKNIRIALN